jgi:hypothetical protein
VTVGKELPQPQFRSAWPDINAKDPALVTALQQGTMIEEVYGTTLPASLTCRAVRDRVAGSVEFAQRVSRGRAARRLLLRLLL